MRSTVEPWLVMLVSALLGAGSTTVQGAQQDAAEGHAVTELSPAAEEVRIISHGDEISFNIYCERPFMDPSSRYVMYLRLPGVLAAPDTERPALRTSELWRADLQESTAELVASGVWGVRGMAVSPDQHDFYFVTGEGDGPTGELEAQSLTRVDIATLERETIPLTGRNRRIGTMGSISPGGHYIAGVRLDTGRYGILRADLPDGELRIIHEGGADIFNAHPQVEPGKGSDLLIQHNRGAEFTEDGKLVRPFDKTGTTFYLIDIDGGNLRLLNVGIPHTPQVQGHQAWLGETGSILFTTYRPPPTDTEHGNIRVIDPGEPEARSLSRDFNFWHCNPSLCGRYFVADTRGGPIVRNTGPSAAESPYLVQEIPTKGLIVVGSIATGKTRVLCESLAAHAKPQYTHPHPYLSPDRKWVVFNSVEDGVPHVAAAKVPDGLLESLDRP